MGPDCFLCIIWFEVQVISNKRNDWNQRKRTSKERNWKDIHVQVGKLINMPIGAVNKDSIPNIKIHENLSGIRFKNAPGLKGSERGTSSIWKSGPQKCWTSLFTSWIITLHNKKITACRYIYLFCWKIGMWDLHSKCLGVWNHRCVIFCWDASYQNISLSGISSQQREVIPTRISRCPRSPFPCDSPWSWSFRKGGKQYMTKEKGQKFIQCSIEFWLFDRDP